MTSVRPSEIINKALVSTTSSFVGEYEIDGLLVGHAWPGLRDRAAAVRGYDGPASRNAFVFAFETPQFTKTVGVVLPDYSGIPELLCWYLSVLFGKRFDNHGLLETIGHFNLPNMEQFGVLCNHTLPHNSRTPRVDYSIPLNLSEITRIEPLLSDRNKNQVFLRIFQTASKFYSQAIQSFERDSEVAYLHLVTAIEVLSSSQSSTASDSYEPTTAEYLERIERELAGGAKIARHFREKMFSIKRRFVSKLTELVDEEFFARSECQEPYGQLKAKQFRKNCGAAYDLRSQYIHTGVPFGSWIGRSIAGINSEVQVGHPVVESKSYAKALANAPTFIGLERIVRYCLLKSAEQQKLYVEPPPSEHNTVTLLREA